MVWEKVTGSPGLAELCPLGLLKLWLFLNALYSGGFVVVVFFNWTGVRASEFYSHLCHFPFLCLFPFCLLYLNHKLFGTVIGLVEIFLSKLFFSRKVGSWQNEHFHRRFLCSLKISSFALENWFFFQPKLRIFPVLSSFGQHKSGGFALKQFNVSMKSWNFLGEKIIVNCTNKYYNK